MGNKDIISDSSARNKGGLVLGNQLRHQGLQSLGKNLGVDLVVNVTHQLEFMYRFPVWPVIFQVFRAIVFQY